MRESRFLAVLLFVSVLILTSCGGGAASSPSSQPLQQTPNFSSATSRVDFGSELVNGGTLKQTVTLNNTGNGNLVISGISVTGANAKDFSFSGPTMPITVGANTTLKLDLSFTPVESGNLSATLQFTDNAAGSPHTITLAGTGTAPAVKLNPNAVQFGAAAVSGGAVTRTVVVDNSSGTGDLLISNITVGGANPSDFSTSASSMTVKAGTTKKVTVMFAAGAAGARSAALVLTDNAAGSPHSIGLAGTGITGPAQNPNATIAVTPDSLAANTSFPTTFNVTITGTGTNFAAGSTVASFGPGAAVTDGSQGATGVPGAFGVVNVTSPTTATAQVTFDSTAAAGPRFVMVTTDGVHFSTATFVVPAHGGPVANAGASQFVDLGSGNSTVHLDASASGAVESNPIAKVHANVGTPTNPLLTYQWTFLVLPDGSTASFDDPTAVRPTFIADKAGNYLVQLTVTDNSGNTTSAWVLLSSLLSLPVARAGDPQFVTSGATVQLDGSGSTDAKGNALSYQWQFLSVPNGSSASLSNATAVAPRFVADLPGDYRVRLTVSDGHGNTSSDTVLISTSKTPPVAKAGPNHKVSLNDQAQLDGSASFDPDGETLTCSWSLLALPAGSGAHLTNAGPGACSTKTGFTVDQLGTYVAQLVVTDSSNNSSVATVLLSTEDPGPIANAGQHQLVNVNDTATLDGTASTSPAGGNLTYAWSLLFKPSTSSAVITNATSATPTFVPDVTGDYVFQLAVTDSMGLSSAPATVRITAATPGFSIDHTTLNFGSQTVNTTSDSTPIVITNNGNGILSISDIKIDGAQAADFGKTAAALPVTVGPGASTTINVTFTPSAGGQRSATLTITNNAVPPVTVQLSGTGGIPVSQFSTNTLSFGAQLVGVASAAQTVTINNTGNGTLSISSITMTGTQPGDFSVSPNTAQNVAPGSSVTLSVTFKPTQAGGRSAVLSIVDNASASAETVTLSGTGTAPGISANPTSITFADQLIHTASAPTPITITNTGTADLHITAMSADIADFATPTSTPITVAPSATTQINVTFTPNLAGNRSGTLSIKYDAGTYTITLTGRAIAPDITADKTVSFPDTLVGNTSTMAVTITNSGTAPLTITSVAGVTGVVVSDTTNYQVVDAPSTPIAPGSSAAVHINFKPTTRGSHPATLTIPSDAVSGPATVSLSGTGLQPGISLDKATLNFANQLLNTASAPLVITVTNNGNSPLHISVLSVSGANATDFSTTTTVPITVAAGATAPIAVVFTPAGLGPRNATLSITNDAGANVDVRLSGAGVQPGITVQTSLNFANQTVSTTGNTTLTITNPGTAPLHITSLAITLNNAEFAVTTAAPVVVPANNGTATISLTFTPAQIGSRAGTLTIGSDAPGSPTAVSLTGTGTGAVINVAPNPLGFGSQLVSISTAPSSITITNNGNADLNITRFSIGGGNAGDFSFASGFNPAAPLTIGPGLNATVPIVFTPASIGNRAATLTITANASAPTVQLTGNGTAPGAPTFNPAPVTFNQMLGTTSAPVAVTVTNPSSATGDLIITNVSISGTNAADFTVVPNGAQSITVHPGQTTTLNVTFTPGAAGSRTAQLAITDNAAGSPHSVTLSGTGAVSNISPTTLPFGGQVVGTTSGPQTVTFAYPTGASGNLTFNSFTVTGTNAADFSASIGLQAAPFTITSGQRQISITFTPAAGPAGPRSATLTIADSTGTYNVTLTGTAQAPSFSASPNPLTFADTVVNSTSVATTLTIDNSQGTATLHISNFSVAPSGEFSVTTPAPLDIPAGQSAPVSLTFKPTATGSRSATLNITDNAGGSPHSVALSGKGIASAISFAPNPVAFGNQTINVASSPIQVTITNPGTAPLTISAINSSNPDFTFSPSAPITVQPGAGNSATLNITFKPTSASAESATLTFTDNTVAGSHTLSLSGTGVAPGINANPNPLAFGSQVLLTPSSPLTVTIANNGLGTLVISNLGISGTNSADFAFPSSFVPQYPISVPPNSSTQVPVVFVPGVEGGETALLNITSNANPTSVTLNGTGVAPHFTASPSAVTFTATSVGTSQSQTLTITNSGGTDLVITAIAKSGTNAADFVVSQTTPITVPKNSSVNLTVVFTPSANGSEAATLTFTDNASPSTQQVLVSGSGTAPVMGALPPFTFPSPVFVGSTSSPQAYQINNTGSGPLKIFGLSFTGTNASEFAVISQIPTQQSPLIVPAGGFSSITLSFSPTAVGTRTATLVITDNTGPGGSTVSTDQVSLTATGQPLQANPSYNPTSLTFTPNQKVGTSSAALQVGVTNNGNGDMTITTVAFSGANPGDFQVTTPLPLTVPKNGGTVSLSVVFTPADQGARTATLTINATNVSDNTALAAPSITLGGTGFYVGHFSLNSTSVGANLQLLATGSLDVPPSTNLPVTITSGNPSLVLVEPIATDPSGVNQGVAGFTGTIPRNTFFLPGFFIQALASSGSTTITVSSPGSGYQSAIATVTLTPSGFVFVGPAGTGTNFTALLGKDSSFSVSPVQLDTNGNALPTPLAIRGGSPITVTVNSANPAVGTIPTNPVIQPGTLGSNSVAFHPVAGGTTAISVIAPAGFSTPASGSQVTATVQAPSITLNPLTLGFNQQSLVTGALNQSSPNPVTVTLTSSDATKLLLSTDPNAVGPSNGTITVTVPANATQMPAFYAQALASSGTVTITAAASGYANGVGNVALNKSAFALLGPGNAIGNFSTTSISSASPLTLTLYMLDQNSNLLSSGSLRPGFTGSSAFNITVNSSATTTATVVGNPAVFTSGMMNNTDLSLQPQASCVAPCTTNLTVVQPAGFATPTTGGSMTVTVNKPTLTLITANSLIGQNLQVLASGSLDAGYPFDTLQVTITSNNPNVLLSAFPTAAGSTSVTLSVPANKGVGGLSFPVYYVQSVNLSSGTATLTATVKTSTGADAGYNTVPLTVSFAPAGFVLSGKNGPGQTMDAAANGSFVLNAYAVVLDTASLTPTNLSETVRGGMFVPISASSDSSNATPSSPIFISGGSGSFDTAGGITVQTGPVLGQTSTISIAPPSGFTVPNSGTQVPVFIH